MKVRLLRKALHNLEVIHEYIARDNPEAALKLVIKIRSAVKQLETFPEMGRVGRVKETREIVVNPYFIVYRVNGSFVDILRILHSARKFPD
ncbi:YafQ toxin protein [Pseudanabaena sp. lw0831]|uniref:type II toxin-antitoxin system RelE/ParE family toxin n=1 Tax=Pseudanabaena sp. lw0831 TaxID=1357935 RepID=UPI001916B6EE|nr:type II toxin-antitoxin system RelE/ParE family toxin [Pseudanabaena sp. lw0831]GBO56321.1 YafQ toxin protein [Pseudanabaena sp. lw0831]